MADGEAAELFHSLQTLPVAAIVTELRTHTFVAVNIGAETIFGLPADELVGTDVLARIHPLDRDATRSAYAALADKVIDGYHTQRRILMSRGGDRIVSAWGRRVEDRDNLYGFWILVADTEQDTALETLLLGAPEVVFAVTDFDWQIEYMTADKGLLGTDGSELRGLPLIGMVHPSAVGEFLAAAARCAAEGIAVAVRTRMRTGPHSWGDRYCLLVPIGDHQPRQLGVVISPAPPAMTKGLDEGQLDGHVRERTVIARVTRRLETLPPLATLSPGSELSARQTEVVARLVAGERIPDIARSMFLSASTVRNHLSAIYQKFGVHSQSELLAALLRALVRREQ